MGLFPGSVRQVGDASPIDIVLLDQFGNPVFGFDPSRPANATQAEKTMTAASQLLVASNPARRQVTIENQTNKVLYIAFAAAATPATRVATIPVGGSWSTPLGGYTGDIAGILAGAPSGVNKVYVAEVTP